MGTSKSTTGGQHSFAQIPKAEIQRSSFDRSCGLKTTLDAGDLVPIFCDEALPADTMSMQLSLFARLATPLHPVMDNLYIDVFWFAVPLRLLWDNWAKFNGEQRNPEDSTDFLVPSMLTENITGEPVGSLSDYIGIPTEVPGLEHTALFHRAYNLIWTEWFRDENLQDSVVNNTGDGPDDRADYAVLKRGKRHDYFTSCLPWPQKGPAVELPLGTSAPVTTAIDGVFNYAPVMSLLGQPEAPVFRNAANSSFKIQTQQASTNAQWDASPNETGGDAEWKTPNLSANVGGILATGTADLTAATAATINSIRQAFQIQRLYERDARGGTRYTEIVRSHFGVTSPDQRLQRPEFLGGGTTPIHIQPVPQTSNSEAGSTEQGNLAGYGIAQSSGGGFTKSFVEHTIIIGLASVRADLNYQQGLNRMFSRRTRWDFFWPALANLGEQSVLNKEIYAQGSDDLTADADVFGYQERFAEYRYKPSSITGQFRSTFAQSLDTWHLAQDFGSLPLLNDEFIEENPPMDRIVAVPSEPDLLLDTFFKYRCARPMPVYGVPGQIDHF